MTTIVGVAYPSGIIMASDLLVTKLDEIKFEESKIYHAGPTIWGIRGAMPPEIELRISAQIKEAALKSVDELVRSEFARILREANVQMRDAAFNFDPFGVMLRQVGVNALLGTYHEERFNLWYSNGLDEELKMVGSLSILMPLGELFLNYCGSSPEHAIQIAVSKVRENNQEFPDASSGLEVFHMTKEEVKRESEFSEPVS